MEGQAVGFLCVRIWAASIRTKLPTNLLLWLCTALNSIRHPMEGSATIETFGRVGKWRNTYISVSVVGNESDRESPCYSFESHYGWGFFVLEFSLASRSSHLDTTNTNEIKHGIIHLWQRDRKRRCSKPYGSLYECILISFDIEINKDMWMMKINKLLPNASWYVELLLIKSVITQYLFTL